MSAKDDMTAKLQLTAKIGTKEAVAVPSAAPGLGRVALAGMDVYCGAATAEGNLVTDSTGLTQVAAPADLEAVGLLPALGVTGN